MLDKKHKTITRSKNSRTIPIYVISMLTIETILNEGYFLSLFISDTIMNSKSYLEQTFNIFIRIFSKL